jgi:hypothetical protein
MNTGVFGRFAAVIAVAYALAVILIGGDDARAATQQSAALASAAPTPTPAPNNCKNVDSVPDPTAANADITPDVTFCLQYRANPGFNFSKASALHPNPNGEPLAIANLPRLAFDANEGSQSAANGSGLVFAFNRQRSGPTHRLMNGVPFAPDEHRFAIIIQRDDDTTGTSRIIVEVNDAGACVESGKMLSDDLFAACKVTNTRTGTGNDKGSSTADAAKINVARSAKAQSPAPPITSANNGPTAGPGTAPKPTPTPAPNNFPISVTIPWTAVNELFGRPVAHPVAKSAIAKNPDLGNVSGPTKFDVCYVDGIEQPDSKKYPDPKMYYDDVVASLKRPISPPPDANLLACTQILVAYRQLADQSVNYQAGTNSSKAPAGSANSATSSHNRELASTATPAATPAPTSGTTLTGTFLQPLNAYLQLSLDAQTQTPLQTSLSSQTNTTLTNVVNQQLAQQNGAVVPGGLGSSTTSTVFTVVDTDVLNRLLPKQFRGYSDAATTLTNAPQAFDGTHVLGLTPFDPTILNPVTVGGKLTSVNPLLNITGQRLGLAGIGWFHDSTTGQSGSIFHIDQDLTSSFSFGFSQVVANTVTPPTNLYVAHPNPADPAVPATNPANPILHSSNTVLGTLFKFGEGDDESKEMQLFTRFATNGLGRDWTAAISSANLGVGDVIKPDGTAVNVAFLGGYRSISYAYAPLLTGFDPFAGNQIYFGRANIVATKPGSTDPTATSDRSTTFSDGISFAAVYADNGGARGYASFGAAPSRDLSSARPNGMVDFSLTGVLDRSYISSTILARQSGNVIVPRTLNLLDNDAASLSLQIQNSDTFFKKTAWTFTASAGYALTHNPNCPTPTGGGTPTCTSPPVNKPTWTANAGFDSLVFYANSAPGSTRTNATSVTASIPSNAMVTTGAVAYHFCGFPAPKKPTDTTWGIEPTFSASNNIAQDGSAFQHGTLLEIAMDFGPAAGVKALGSAILNVSYKNAANAAGTPVALKNNGFGINLVNVSQAAWLAHKTKNDPCLAAKTGSSS